MNAPAASDIERFERFISPEPNSGCWLWTGAGTPAGYGYFGFGQRQNGRLGSIGAHRFAFMAWRGALPNGAHVLHRCDVPCCVNPDHLFLGNQGSNMRDMAKKGRHRLNNIPLKNSLKSHCCHGHPLSGENLWVRKDGSRICKTCRARIARNWRKSQ